MLLRLSVLTLVLAGTVLISFSWGSYAFGPADIWRTLSGAGTPMQELAMFSIRLPRLMMAALVGGSLALAGAILQGVSRNGLADPGILGLNAGAGFVVIVLLYMQQADLMNVSRLFWPPLAFAGAGLAATAVYLLARKNGLVEPGRLLLSGIAVNAGLGAAILVLSMRLDRRLYESAAVWLAGSLSGARFNEAMILLPWVCVLIGLLVLLVKMLDIIELGDLSAAALGVPVERGRLLLIGTAVGFSGAAVAFAGNVGFIGLLGPHIARQLVGPRHHRLLPAAAVIGAGLVILADTLGRNLLAPIEMPVGVVVAVIGAPYFLYLLSTSTR